MSAKSSNLFHEEVNPNTVLILSGATSVGKSSVAMELCRHINGEIVISDSVQVYKHLDIGSTKPTAAEMEEVPHHLVGINEPSDQLSTGDYVRLAARKISDILGRGKVPVVVGGATMWLQWLVHGIPDAPKATPEIVEQASKLLEEFRGKYMWEEAFALVAEYDPVGVTKFERNDWYRLQRCLEIALQLKKLGRGALVGARTSNFTESIDFRTIFVCENRTALYHTIDRRCLELLRMGHITETAELLRREILLPEYPIAKAIGYRQTIEYLSRGAEDETSLHPSGDDDAFDRYFNNYCAATRSYASRQINWYRKDKKFLFVEIFRPEAGDAKEAYRRVAEEVWHWATVPRDVFDASLEEQISVGEALTDIIKKKKIPHDYIPSTPSQRLALSWLIATEMRHYPSVKELELVQETERLEFQIKKIEKKMSRTHVDDIVLREMLQKDLAALENQLRVIRSTEWPMPEWVGHIQDESLGITPERLKERDVLWSALNVDIRTINREEDMFKFKNEALVNEYYFDLIEEADEQRRILFAEKRELLVRCQSVFSQQHKQKQSGNLELAD
eukprot:CAMPEP_0170432956 /NCGR_PEP_ID=MMETSP0117_2-20130122/42237_1 /TAXON_ID=400756 /ORGANISM="Durinskia baltica, Strain CSIRO CS-38" /LENGTH=562 /DNA_ID=CAMNT_0010692665 /DNA_START=147 /DNA_END=1835 /DNA_ORIENTATION=-